MKKTIAVFFGGRSAEHDVSIITAHIPIIESLIASNQFEVWPVYISKDGSWYADQAFNDLAYFKQPDFEDKIAKQKKVHLVFDNGLILCWPGLMAKKIKIDVAFPAMHGTYGEDGSLMGLLRMANIPFVGCDMAASAIAMDKVLTKQILAAENVPTVPYVWFTKHDWQNNQPHFEKQIEALAWPLFVKPVHLGSSIGISKVKNQTELANAIELAFHYDDKVLVEKSIEDLTEVTLPIIGNNELTLASIEKPLNKTDFFDFTHKYLSGGKKGGGVNNQYSEIPANIDSDLAEQVKNLGQKTYRALGLSGIARVDFLIENNSQTVYVNEVNTLPGSLYQHNWKKSGMSGVELVTKLVTLAEEKFKSNADITHTFTSTILQKAGGAKFGA